MEIAVFVSESGETAVLPASGWVRVYRKYRPLGWRLDREKVIAVEDGLSLQSLRQEMYKVIEFLGNCKIFVGASVVGVPYFILDQAGFSIWEYPGRPSEFLDYIQATEEENQIASVEAAQQAKEAGTSNLVPAPTKLEDGKYFLSLKEIQENNSGFSSKQALLPFLRQGEFYELELLCSHVPPWLEMEIADKRYQAEVHKISSNELKMCITKPVCQC